MCVASKIPLHATYAQPVHSVAQVRKKAYPCLSNKILKEAHPRSWT